MAKCPNKVSGNKEKTPTHGDHDADGMIVALPAHKHPCFHLLVPDHHTLDWHDEGHGTLHKGTNHVWENGTMSATLSDRGTKVTEKTEHVK